MNKNNSFETYQNSLEKGNFDIQKKSVNTTESFQKNVTNKVQTVVRRGLVFNTIGRLFRPKIKAESSKIPKREIQSYIEEKLNVLPPLASQNDPLVVNIGNVPALRNTKRFLKRTKGEMGFFPRVFNGARVFLGSVSQKFFPENNDDPNTNTLTLVDRDKAHILHEVGHYVARQKEENAYAYNDEYETPEGCLKHEFEASQIAMKLASPEERTVMGSDLEKMFATYEKYKMPKGYDYRHIDELLGRKGEFLRRRNAGENIFFVEGQDKSFQEELQEHYAKQAA